MSPHDQDLSSIPEVLTLWQGKQAERNDKYYVIAAIKLKDTYPLKGKL